MHDIEDSVLESAKRGDRSCREEVFRYVLALGTRVLARRTPKTELDDLVQDCALRILRCLPTLRDRSHLRHVVIISAKHAFLDHVRKASVRDRIELLPPDEMGHLALEQPNPLEMEEVEAIVNAALSRMALHLRQSYRLLCGEGLTMKAAAERLNVSASAMRRRSRKLITQFMKSFHGR
jgi:RNA polymerase sigma factor (sigma-70 family)